MQCFSSRVGVGRIAGTVVRQLRKMSVSAQAVSPPKVVFIVGTTAVGKSRLGVEIAEKVGGEVINADSIQVYQDLEITSAKVTVEEMRGIPHHLMSFVPPFENFTVKDFIPLARQKIQDICDRGKVPIVVGGTFYYAEGLMRKSFLSSQMSHVKDRDEAAIENRKNEIRSLEERGLSLYEQLKEIDPLMAERLHPNEIRKINRSLEVYVETSRRHSELIMEDVSVQDEDCLSYDLCIIWLDANRDVLRDRVNIRVDKMMELGLLNEVRHLHKKLKAFPDRPSGLKQTIGYKEFIPFLDHQASESSEDDSQDILMQCIERLKIATRQYLKKQLQWIRNRLLLKESVLSNRIYRFDTTKLDKWDESVLQPVCGIIKEFLSGNLQTIPPSLYAIYSEALESRESQRMGERPSLQSWKKYECKICEKTLNGEHEYNIHIKTKKHRKQLKALNNQCFQVNKKCRVVSSSSYENEDLNKD